MLIAKLKKLCRSLLIATELVTDHNLAFNCFRLGRTDLLQVADADLTAVKTYMTMPPTNLQDDNSSPWIYLRISS